MSLILPIEFKIIKMILKIKLLRKLKIKPKFMNHQLKNHKSKNKIHKIILFYQKMRQLKIKISLLSYLNLD